MRPDIDPPVIPQLLRRAAAGALPGAGLPAKLAAAESGRLVAAAAREGLAGFLRQGLRRAGGLKLLAEPARRELDRLYYRTLRDNVQRLAALRVLLAALEGAGLSPAVLQGAALLLTHYEDPGVRPLTDLDLWVAPQEGPPARAVLGRLGFENDPAAPALFRRGTVLVDLHTRFLGEERIRARRFLWGAGGEQALRPVRRAGRDGAPVTALAPVDEVIHLACHAAKHNLERLVWLADLRSLTAAWTPADWAALERRAASLGLGRVPGLVAYALEALLGITPAAGGSGTTALSRCLVRRRRRRRLPAWACLALLPPAGIARCALLIGEFLLPRVEVLAEVFPQHAAASPRRLRAMRLRQILGLAASGR
jgi:hypothetical protein